MISKSLLKFKRKNYAKVDDAIIKTSIQMDSWSLNVISRFGARSIVHGNWKSLTSLADYKALDI